MLGMNPTPRVSIIIVYYPVFQSQDRQKNPNCPQSGPQLQVQQESTEA